MPEPIAQITIALFADGAVAANIQGQIDDLAVFQSLATAQVEITKQLRKRRERQIQIAPAGPLQLPN